MTAEPTLYLTVGLPGAGKTTRATLVAAEEGILRLTPDEWMAPLFGHNDAGGRRDILEGRMVWVAHEVLVSGSGVVLDFGCWSVEERLAVRAVAEGAGGRFRMLTLDVEEDVRRQRAARRWAEQPATTFEMSEEDHDRFLASYQPPTEDEVTADLPAAPAGYPTWGHWASARWPTLPVLRTPR